MTEIETPGRPSKTEVPKWDEAVDFLIVGGGGGSLCAAMACQDAGLTALVLEKTGEFGGSTAMSGGVLWVPNHPLQRGAGVEDSYERGRAYMDAVIGDAGKESSPQRRDAFLRAGPQLIDYLQSKGVGFIRCEGWSDYYDELPGGCPRGRSLMVKLFDARELGPEWRPRLRRGGMQLPLQGTESWRLQIPYSVSGLRAALNLGVRVAWSRLTGKDLVGVGMALQGRMLQAALRQGIPLRLDAPVVELITENNEVVGVVAEVGGRTLRVAARRGVLINAGGFSRNREMREAYTPRPSDPAWTNASPGDTGEVMRLAITLGAATANLDQAIWLPSSQQPDGALAWHVFDIAKPHAIVVDKAGSRFFNEGESYMAKGHAMYANGAVPCFAILDSRHRRKYMWSATPPGRPPAAWIDSGYMKQADTIEGLAEQCGIDPRGLRDTIERFNGYATIGADRDFHRGDRTYDRIFGDPRMRPNPALGTIERPPFYAVELIPGDVGTCGGLVTDEHARVLRDDGTAIRGLYATGNTTASVMGKVYPGAGASISASFIFGWLAARHAIGAEKPNHN